MRAGQGLSEGKIRRRFLRGPDAMVVVGDEQLEMEAFPKLPQGRGESRAVRPPREGGQDFYSPGDAPSLPETADFPDQWRFRTH